LRKQRWPAIDEAWQEDDMLLSKKIKIEVSEQDAQALEWMQGKCRGLYNWWVMRLSSGERWNFQQCQAVPAREQAV